MNNNAQVSAPRTPKRIFDVSGRVDGRFNVWELVVDPQLDLSTIPIDSEGRYPEYIGKRWVNKAVFLERDFADAYVKAHGVQYRNRRAH